MKPTPRKKECFLCRQSFIAEWARTRVIPRWHISEICPRCEARLRERAA